MKKIMILALIALLASCSEEQMKKWNEMHSREKNPPDEESYHKGHHYFIWRLSGVVHDPDCPCHLDTLDVREEKDDTICRIKKKEL